MLPNGQLDVTVICMVLQHNEDEEVRRLLTTLTGMLSRDGRMLVLESVAPERHDWGTMLTRSSREYEEMFRECGLEVEREFSLSSPVYRHVAPVARRLAAGIARILGLSERGKLRIIDIFCTPAVLASWMTDGILKTSDWAYKAWWLKAADCGCVVRP